MNIDVNAMGKAFDPEEVYVSLFEVVVPRYAPGSTDEQKLEQYAKVMDYPKEIKLTEFLGLGGRYINFLKRIWQEPDKKKRRAIKKFNLAGAVISCMVKTRRKNLALSEKVKQYNSVVVLDFDDVFDVEDAKKRVAALPYVWFVGLSASKRGMYAIVPVDNEDYGRHEIFYYALTREMKKLGLEVDQQCKPVNWLRYVAFDENPIYNQECCRYALPEGLEDEYWAELAGSGRPLPTDADDVELFYGDDENAVDTEGTDEALKSDDEENESPLPAVCRPKVDILKKNLRRPRSRPGPAGAAALLRRFRQNGNCSCSVSGLPHFRSAQRRASRSGCLQQGGPASVSSFQRSLPDLSRQAISS